jgi:hypothetical protein
MKSPPEQYTDAEARIKTLQFIGGDDQGRVQLAS